MESDEPSNHFSYFLFHLMGAFSTLSLFLVLLYSVASIFKGDFQIWNNFIQAYPGSQPFLIFIAPVILISSLSWLFFMQKKGK